MRRRLEREVAVPSSNTKTAPGGYYDVDFAVSYTRLRQRIVASPGANMAEQIAALRAAEAISAEDAAALTEGAGFLRSVDHILRLVTGKAPTGLPESAVPRGDGGKRGARLEPDFRGADAGREAP